METRREIRGLHVITDESYVRGRTHREVAAAATAGGANVVQFRDKTASGRRLYEVALEIRRITAAAGVTFIVNDRVDIAFSVGADGVHIGQEDLPIEAVRRILGKDKIIGASVGNVEEALAAIMAGADYIGFGPIFATGSKSDAGEPVGLEALAELASRVDAPVIAIGGITADNLAEVMTAGATGAAVISAVAAVEDMHEATRSLVQIISSVGH